jgi:nucleoside-diphosphate-sugar epimerase
VRILVIGTGMVGGAAVSALSERGHEVTARLARPHLPWTPRIDARSVRCSTRSDRWTPLSRALGSAPYKPLGDLGPDDFLSGLLAKALSR